MRIIREANLDFEIIFLGTNKKNKNASKFIKIRLS